LALGRHTNAGDDLPIGQPVASRRGGGGAANQAGTDFQNRAAAWVAVHILAEQAASPPWDLPQNATLEFLRCETEQPVDDLLVGTSGDGVVYVQVKRTLSLQSGSDSDLASTLDQFVRQFILRRGTTGAKPWERPLDPLRDRLVLVAGPGSSGSIRRHLPSVLHRLSALVPGQGLEDAAGNQEERQALCVVRDHLTRSWKNHTASDPSDDDLRRVLSFVRVHVLDVENGGADDREAAQLLRSSILHDKSQAELAWNTLVQACASFAASSGGADRPSLQRLLLDAGIHLQAVHSYQTDIRTLRAHSDTTVTLLSDLARIWVGAVVVKIHREATSALRQAAEEGPLLVVGVPGAGKSGVLHDLVAGLQDEGRDVVYLAVDRWGAQSLGALRIELGLTHDLVDVLKNWHGPHLGFLVIDALDAARSEVSARTFRDVISQAISDRGRWHVVASMREYDLRHSDAVQRLFVGTPASNFQSSEFYSVRYLKVDKLSVAELDQVRSQSEDLANLVAAADPALRDLLRVPFNLHLMGELLRSGVAPGELTPIRTQVELLDRYWIRRVIGEDRQGDERESALRRAAGEMVRTRSLRADRAVVTDVTTGAILEDLLSANILSEWRPSPTAAPDRYVLAFSHHVLFDYAVARLLVPRDPRAFATCLADDPDLVLAIHPSLVFHAQAVWLSDQSRDAFWDLVFRVIKTDGVPEVGKLIGPGVAADSASQLTDFAPLLAALNSVECAVRDAADQTLRHVFGALLAAAPSPEHLLVGEAAGPWCELLEHVSGVMRPATAYTVRLLLTTAVEHPEKLTSQQRNHAGLAARWLLEFAWSQTPRDGWLVIHALQAVCRTFESDPGASAVLLRHCLEPERLAQFGFEEMPWLAREVARLVALDPSLMEDIYRAAFTYQDLSDEHIPMGASQILGMVVTRRQHYGTARRNLAKAFPDFLVHVPAQATQALVAAMEGYVSERHLPTDPDTDTLEEEFDIGGRRAHIKHDYSCIWDEGVTYRDDEALQMLGAFQAHLLQVARDIGREAERRTIVDVIVDHNRPAVVWRRVLRCATHAPGTLGTDIRCLSWALPVLTCADTTTAAGDFLAVVFSHFDLVDRQRIEETILSIPSSATRGSVAEKEHMRDRLLGCLPPEHLVTTEARQQLERLASANAVPRNEPLFSMGEVTSEPYTEEKHLADLGVAVEAEANRRVRSLEQPAKEFAQNHGSSSPTAEEVEAVLPALDALWKALSTADADGVDPKQRDYAWGHLTGACESITRWDGLSCADDTGRLVRAILLQAAQYPDPVPHPEYDAQFDEHPSWGSPAARIDAAAALTELAHHQTCADGAVLEAVRQLSADPVPAVRFQVAHRLRALSRAAPQLMRALLERFCEQETSRGVLQGLLSDPLPQLATQYPYPIGMLTKTIYDRTTSGAGAESVREACAVVFVGLYLRADEPQSQEMLLSLAHHPYESPDEAQRVIAALGRLLAYGPAAPPDPIQDGVRRRALNLIGRILHATWSAWQEMERCRSEQPARPWTDEERSRARTLAQVADSVGTQIYFASGAYTDTSQTPSAHALDTDQKRRFLEEVGPLLDELAQFGFPSTVHHLLETLAAYVAVDPEGVFLRIGRIVAAGKAGGYQYESLAADLIVGLVEKYLAEHRTVFRKNVNCRRTLIEILDIFVQVGWPSARRLTYRMEEIFR
jgi:hypothetical protein